MATKTSPTPDDTADDMLTGAPAAVGDALDTLAAFVGGHTLDEVEALGVNPSMPANALALLRVLVSGEPQGRPGVPRPGPVVPPRVA